MTTASVQADPAGVEERRRARWKAFYWLRGASSRRGARQCFLPVSDDQVGVQVGVTEAGVVHVNGTKRCGSVWACPLCAPVVRERRAGKVDELLALALADGCELAFVTATVQHDESRDLATLWDGVQASWRRAFSGRDAHWPRYIGQIRAFDLTDGENGWHPHIHAVLVFGPTKNRQVIDRWLSRRKRQYLDALGQAGLFAADDRRGWDVRVVSRKSRDSAQALGRYVAKVEGGWGAGLELARGDVKSGRRGGRNAFELLRAASSGCVQSAVRFAEYEAHTAGKRLIVTGRKLAQRYHVDPDAGTDEELAFVQPDGTPFAVLWYPTCQEWRRLMRLGHLGDVLAHLAESARELHGQQRAGP